MALSNQYSYGSAGGAPSLGEIGLYCLNRVGVKRTAVLQEHMADLRIAANNVCMDFSNKQVNLWKVELVSQPLTEGVATYDVDPAVVFILDCYRTQGSGEETIDQILLPVSRTEYASYPNKQQLGVPTTFWHERTFSPTINLYLTPDGTWPTLNYYAVLQTMDANLANGGSVDVPATWFKAFTDALTAELSLTWAFEKYQTFAAVAAASYLAAAEQDTEIAANYISPLLGSYWTQ